MKLIITKTKDKTQQSFDVKTFHFLSEEKTFVCSLNGGYLATVPEKTIYEVVMKDDSGKELASYSNMLFVRYNFTMDQQVNTQTNPDGAAQIINNSMGFLQL